MHTDKPLLFERGCNLLRRFCDRNSMQLPDIRPVQAKHWAFNVCAYYRPAYIEICVPKCAAVGSAGMAWSYPGHTVDRTPYGVLAHELGHHADVQRSVDVDRYMGDFSIQMREWSKETKLTNYCPNDAEWFAEMFRLYVTNSDLLRALRPMTWALLRANFEPVVTAPWQLVLADAPTRTVAAINSKLRGKGPCTDTKQFS